MQPLQLLHTFLGLKLGSSCSFCKHFTHGTMSSALLFHFLEAWTAWMLLSSQTDFYLTITPLSPLKVEIPAPQQDMLLLSFFPVFC